MTRFFTGLSALRQEARSFVLGAVAAASVWAAATVCAGVERDWIMYLDPELKRTALEYEFPEELVDRWVVALGRPEREMKRRAAAAIARAHGKGLAGLEVTIEPLAAILARADEDRIVRLAAARALVAIDARQAADSLFACTSEGDLDMAEVVEPALARWNYTPMGERWRKRLSGQIGLRRMVVLAIRGLAATGDKETLPRLFELASDPVVPAGVRLEAADALGILQEEGLLASAKAMAEDKSPEAVAERLVAARMLAAHRGPEAEKLLAEMALDPMPSVRAVALGHLFRIDPALILPMIEEVAASDDANVRRIGAETVVAEPTPELLAVLGPMLDDPDPDIRRYVCDSLVALAENDDLSEAVIAQGRRMLAGEGWRGQEQAALLLVTLDEKSVVDRLLELLESPRPEVHVTAAWGLCRLAVPGTAERIFETLEQKTEACLAGQTQKSRLGDQLAFLAQALGVMDFRPADALLRKYIPKGIPLSPESRAAAIWALGHFHAGESDDELAELFRGRMLDMFSDEPEAEVVCRLSAVSIGRMKSEQMLPVLRNTARSQTIGSGVGYACYWAIHHMTGEAIPALEPSRFSENDWFMVPTVEQ